MGDAIQRTALLLCLWICCCVCGGSVVQFTSVGSVAWDRSVIIWCQAHGHLYGHMPIVGMVQQDPFMSNTYSWY